MGFLETEAHLNSKDQQKQKMWNVFRNIPFLPLYALGLIINVFRPWDKTMPVYAPPAGPVDVDNFVVNSIEYRPAAVGTLVDQVSANVRALVDATPPGAGRAIAIWPEYGIVNDAYFDRERGGLLWNGVLTYLGGGSLPYALVS